MFLKRMFWFAAALTVFISGCGRKDESRLDIKKEHEKRIAEGFRHYHISNPEDQPYNLVVLAEVRYDGKFRICAAGYAKGARDTGSFDVYVKPVENGFHLHYFANGGYVKMGVGGYGDPAAKFVISPKSAGYGDFIAKKIQKSSDVSPDNWQSLASEESGFALVTMLWDGDFAPGSPEILEALKNRLLSLWNTKK